MVRPSPLSGFPEWLPAQRAVESHVLDTLRHTFELHGFAGIETRAVERISDLMQQGETAKEVYAIHRVHDASEESGAEGGLGLHFDLTVPLARYVVENAGRLSFPFKRYQLQKVWRGERPQEGRFREFTQADIDVVGHGELPFHYEVELPLVMAEALRALNIGQFRMAVNNRKIAEGFYRGIGLDNVEEALRVIDKLDKIGPHAVAAQLRELAGATEEQARQALSLAGIAGEEEDVVAQVRGLGASTPLLQEGLEELSELLRAAAHRVPGVVVADLSIARGLDYYTGSVYETTLMGHEDLGSICSGGRYDSLATSGSVTYPGVGLSIGVSRLVARLLDADVLRANRSVPTAVLVAVTTEAQRSRSEDVASALRRRDIPSDVAPTAAKFGKQIRHADRLGIPFVWFIGEQGEHEVKDIRSGQQTGADPHRWVPPQEDWHQRVVSTTSIVAPQQG